MTMKKLLWSVAAMGLLATACSKDQVEEHVTEGGSALATPVGGSARFGNPDALPEVWFDTYEDRMRVRLAEQPNRIPFSILDATVSFDGETTESTLSRVGNSPNFRSAANSFNFSDDQYFSLLNVSISTRNHFIDDWDGETAYLQLFLYPSGRTVVQDPKVMRVTSKLSGSGEGIIEFNVVLADDPAQEVSLVELRIGDDAFVIEKTHFNQALGLARYGTPIPSGVFTTYGDDSPDVSLTVKTGESYTQAFGAHGHVYSHVSGGVIPGRVFCGSGPCMVRENVDAGMVRWMYEETSDPVILGSKLTSRNNGGTFNLTVAVAELGDPLQTVRCTFGESDGPAPIGDTFLMQLVGEGEGGLKVYEVSGIRFNGNPAGSEYEIFFQFGTGTRSTAGNAKQKAELL